MSTQDTPPDFDPMKAWREWFVKNERDWSEAITTMIKDDKVSRGLGQEFNASVIQRQALAKQTSGFMSSMNLPTREDFVALGERVGQLEDAVARVEALLVQLHAGQVVESAKPPRTRQAPRKTRTGSRHAAE